MLKVSNTAQALKENLKDYVKELKKNKKLTDEDLNTIKQVHEV